MVKRDRQRDTDRDTDMQRQTNRYEHMVKVQTDRQTGKGSMMDF